jgi:hypothetical protein
LTLFRLLTKSSASQIGFTLLKTPLALLPKLCAYNHCILV